MEHIQANQSSVKCTVGISYGACESKEHVQICALKQNKLSPHQFHHII